uniref:Uncharacterized protein n=2 Tax=Amphiprion percula TaxID=161767 RepID=A0A3P8RZU5_AMPPE
MQENRNCLECSTAFKLISSFYNVFLYQYNALRAKRTEAGYSEDDLKESYGFLLFDDANKANALGEAGVLAGNSTCTTLGDPSKGVYISMYSDCLDLNRWYHGKSGYIAIIRLTKGKVKKVLENYTQNFTAPTVGYDCHVSEQLPSVSAKTSSFLAFERTQYYMYELLDDGSNKTAQCPSAACPFAIVSFSYTDTKATPVTAEEKSETTKLVCHYLPWRGQLQIGSQFYSVGMRCTAGAIIPAQLPPVVKVDGAISMSDLRKLLPRAVFESCIAGEVFLDGLYCSLCELVPPEAEETSSLAQLLCEIKEKDLSLAVPLNDGGFLILLHSSHFLTYDDTGSSVTDVLQGMFVFPESRAVVRDTKSGLRNSTLSSEIHRVLPLLSYAEGEIEKTPIDPSEDLCEVLAQHMQCYAALISPGLAFSPSREVSIFPDQYDVPDAHKDLYSSPEWSNRAWQSLKSYLSKQASFQLPVSKASEILAAGEEERREDLDDDVYICVSSPEEAPASPVSKGLEDHLSDQTSLVHVETSADSGISSAEVQVDLPTVPQNVVPDNLQTGDATKDNEKCSDLIVLKKTDDMDVENILTPLVSHDLPAELIVSITSAGRSVTDKTQGVVSTVSTRRHSDFPFSGLLHTSENNSVSNETDKTVLDCSKDNPPRAKQRKLRSRLSKGQKETSMSCVATPSLQTPGEKDSLNFRSDEHNEESSDHTQLSNPSSTDWRKLRRKRRFGKLSAKNKKARFATVGLAIAEEEKSDLGQPTLESTILMHLETGTLKKKTERWDLKAVISECGRVLVPHGSVDIADQIKSLKNHLQHTKDEQCPEKMLVDAPVNAADTTEMEQVSSTAPERAVDETEAVESTDDGNHVQNVTVHHVDPEQGTLRQPDGESPSVPLSLESKVHSSKKDDTDSPPSPPEQEKRIDTLPQGRSPAKGEFLFSKLKSVILRGKRKANLTMAEDTTANASPDSEPCLKKDKLDSNIEALNRNNGATQSTNVGVEIVSKVLSVDPLFAYALGLTPKDSPDKVRKTEDQDTQQRKDSTVMIELTSFDKEPKIMHRPPSIFPRGARIKTLKKHQGIPAEYIRKKWWLHFQTPACFASEKLNNKDCTRDNSVRKTVKEKVNSACSSTDALNLLADLALSANNDQVLPQPSPALERKPETSLKKSDVIKGLSSSEQESVLHALLRQPAARSIQALESPSPSQLVGDSELVGLISKEHGYSLPPSSSLLLDLPGTPFQVCPVSGSTRLLHHQQTMNGDGIKTLHPSVGQEDRSDHNDRTPEYLKKYMVHRQKFRYSRNFNNKEGSIQVTRQWKENYDFSLDSKFTCDSKDKAIIRALHGPWDFSVQDTSEEVRLIVHMWIGLFYSRSTARFFHVDSNFTYTCSEDGNSLDISSGITSKPADPELKANSRAASPSVTDTSDPLISKVLDLSKKPNSVSDQESMILDLSLRNTNAEAVTADPQVHRKETSVSSEQKEAGESLTSLKLPAEPSTFQCYEKMIHSTKINSEVKDDSGTLESEKTSTPQKSVCLEHTDVPSFRDDGTLTPQKEMISESVEAETVQTALGIGQMLHGCKKESTDMKDGTESPETTEITQKDQLDSSKSVTNKETDANMEAGDVVHTDESKDEESCEMKEDPSHESNTDTSLKMVHTGHDSASKDSSIICNGHCSDNEELLFKEKPKAVSPNQPENGNVDVDCEGKVIKDKDYFREEHGLDEKKHCVSAVEADKDLRDQPLPVMSDGSDLVNAYCIAESSHQVQLDEQPPPADSVRFACHDSPLKLPCANDVALTDEHAISEKVPHMPSEMQLIDYDPAAEETSETTVPVSDEGTSSWDESCTSLSVPKKKDSVEMENQNPEMSDFSLDLCRNAHEDPESKSTEGEDKVENITQKESFQHQSPSPHHEVLKMFEAEEDFTEEADLKIDDTNEGLDKSCGGVYIPFIGIATCGEDTMQTHGSHPQDKVQKVVQGHEKIPFISDTTDPETVLPNGMCSTPKITAELFPFKLSILEANETNQPVILGSESDSRCPTPTMDENPFGYIPSCGPSISTSDVIGYETCKNIAQKDLRRSSTPINDDPVFKQSLRHTSTGKSDPNLHHDFHPDLEQRTLRVLQSIDKFLSKSNLTGKSKQIKTADITESFAPNRNSKYIPTGRSLSHTSADIKNKKRSNEKPAASDRPDLHTVSSDCPHTLPFEDALEEVHAKFQLERTNSSSYFERPDERESLAGQDFCHSDISSPSVEHLHAMKPHTDQERHKATAQPNLNNEPRPYSQRPVMAVKPSKSEESQAGPSSKDVCIENSAKNKQTKTTDFKYASAISKLLEKKRKAILRGNSKGLNDDEREDSELSSKSTWQANVNHTKPNSDEVKFASHQYQGRDTSESTTIPSSSSSAAKSSPKLVDANQDFFRYSSAEKIDRTTKKKIEMQRIDVSDASTSFIDPADNSGRDDSLTLGHQSSLICTVFNSDQRKSSSFLEQLSQRCLQDDITQMSVEQECLIFSEKMKQLLKNRKDEAICQQDTHDSLRVSCTSPVTVCFSNLEERDDSLYLMDTPMVGQKFKVDMSDRENRTDTTKTLHPEELPQTTSNPVENAWVSSVTAECARMYETTMQDICAVEKISFKPKGCRTDRDYPKTEPSNHFDFCDQMKREMDEAFRSSLNSVVKRSCKTKYRFYILVTSDDVFFEETKAQLEAEGHTAVQPSEFFLSEQSSSSLLIILRNEDIAEHICEVPHLLELKKSPAVQFAGIDEPDDVVNLTHQELFTRGGFIMFDRAALEHLSLCNMKKLSEILQELSSNGKWKWMLHYRDSRRLKENARLSAEAKEKKDFLHWGQDAGILEVLPYHECDLMSRDQPDYLTCLMRLQVQNVSSRYPVFITDTTDSAFERNGILTITLNSFLTTSPSETFTV